MLTDGGLWAAEGEPGGERVDMMSSLPATERPGPNSPKIGAAK